MFIDTTARVAICGDGVIDAKDVTPETDVIFIRDRMDYGTQQKVISDSTRIDMGSKSATPDLGRSNIALMQHNILAWQGPSFRNVACTPENILRLDPTEPLVLQVQREIIRRNKHVIGNDPKLPSAVDAPSASAGEQNGVVPAS